MKNLGERIRELRDEKDLSMRELAKRAGISSAYLSDIEFDKRHPSDDVMHRLADALDTTFKELKEYDTRTAVEEMKQRVSKDPRLGFALRRVLAIAAPAPHCRRREGAVAVKAIGRRARHR